MHLSPYCRVSGVALRLARTFTWETRTAGPVCFINFQIDSLDAFLRDVRRGRFNIDLLAQHDPKKWLASTGTRTLRVVRVGEELVFRVPRDTPAGREAIARCAAYSHLAAASVTARMNFLHRPILAAPTAGPLVVVAARIDEISLVERACCPGTSATVKT